MSLAEHTPGIITRALRERFKSTLR